MRCYSLSERVLTYPLVIYGEQLMRLVFEHIEDPRYGSLVAGAALFMLPTIVLGMISPYSVRLMVTEADQSGHVAGTLYFVSTLGSALGTLATSFYLVLWFEIDTILTAADQQPAGASRPSVTRRDVRVRLALTVIVALLATLARRRAHRSTRRRRCIRTSSSREEGSVRCMQFTVRKDQRNQSCVDQRSAEASRVSVHAHDAGALLLNPAPTNVLIVGLGGGTLPTDARRSCTRTRSIDVVEIDPAVVDVAKRTSTSSRPTTCACSSRTHASG